MTARPETGADLATPRHYDDLLTQVLGGAVDPDYRAASSRRGTGRPGVRLPLVAALVAFGVLIGVSALQTVKDRPAQVAERAQLVAQIHSRQSRLSSLHDQLTQLQESVAANQVKASGAIATERRLDDRLTELSTVVGTTEVTGPGLTITVDDAQGSGSGVGGVVRDSDLQLLANGLWQAGAEAVSIGGERLTSLSSIRFAGRAITVNYRSLTPPYVVEAIGDPDTLAAKLLQTDAGNFWLGLKANYGIRFDIETAPKVVVAAQPESQLEYARETGQR